jgi:serine/threonine protein kinase
VDVSAAKSMPAPDEVFFRDGLGDRLLIRDNQGRPTHESLLIRPELTSIPSFEFALNERIWLVEKFDHPSFLVLRNIIRLPGRLTSISLVHDLSGGTRLSDILARAETTGHAISQGAALFVLKEVLEGLAELHRQSGELAHGAIAPERLVLADGRVRIADYVLGSAIEQLRFTPERYWKELRVAVSSSAGGVRLDRPIDVAQAAMVALAMLAGRPLRESETLGSLGDVMMSISVPQPIRAWMLKALHMDQRRVFVHAGEASKALDEAVAEAGIRPARRDLEAIGGGRAIVTPFKPAAASRPPSMPPAPVVATPPKPAPPVAKPPVAAKPPAAAAKPARDVWQAHDVDPRQLTGQGDTVATDLKRVSAGFKKFLWVGIVLVLMTSAFTGAQFVRPPEWLFSTTGTLVIESNPQGVKVFVNGQPHGVTPLTLKVEAGIHEVELYGPGKPRLFKVHVTRGDRVAQYIEFFRK